MQRLSRALAAFALIALAACEAEPPAAEPQIRPVRYARVMAAGDVEVRTFSGSARAELESDLSFKVSGTLTELPVAVGDTVPSGAVIARIAPADYAVLAEQAEAGLAQARAQERNASAVYERTRGLYENRNASASDLDAARAAYESAQASVRAAAQQLEAARLQLSYTRLYSPADCTIAQQLVEINQNVSAGQPIVRVNCGACAEIVVNVPEVYIDRVSEGMPASIDVGAVGLSDLAGNVSEVGIATSQRGATYPVTIDLEEGCATIRSGMAADATIRLPALGERSDLLVPLVSVGEDGEGNFVWVLEPADTERGTWITRRRAVTIGLPTPDGIVITSGLDPGELIVTAGVRRVSADQTVRLLTDD
jgi:RND family efflux transporter MFP subunit